MFDSYDIYDRTRITLHCVITCQSPLSHIGDVTGNVSNLKTVRLIDLAGNPRQCFAYSGNALRNGILRRRGISAALDSLALQVNPDVHHTLFAGGRIDGGTASDMDLDGKIRRLMPWLSILGTAKPEGVFGSAKVQMVQGRINVGSAYLVCYESAAYVFRQFPGALPGECLTRLSILLEAQEELMADPFTGATESAVANWQQTKAEHLPYLQKQLKTWTECVFVDQKTGRDSLKDPVLQPYLAGAKGQLALLPSKKPDKKKEERSDQRIMSDRLIMAGSKLYSRWDINATDVEIGFVVDTLLQFAKSPYLGGKGNSGNGLVSMDFWYQCGDEKGHFLTVETGQQVLCDRAQNAQQKYQEYMSQYQQFLADAAESKELRALLAA